MKRAIYRYTVFFMVGVLFAALLVPVSYTSWAEGRRTYVSELRAKRRANRERQQAQENAPKENAPAAADTAEKPAEGTAPAAGERRGGGRPEGGEGRRGGNRPEGEAGERRGGNRPEGAAGGGENRAQGERSGGGNAGVAGGGGHGPHGGPPRFRGPRLGHASYQQLGKSVAYVAVPCFFTVILLTGWQHLTQPRKRRED